MAYLRSFFSVSDVIDTRKECLFWWNNKEAMPNIKHLQEPLNSFFDAAFTHLDRACDSSP